MSLRDAVQEVVEEMETAPVLAGAGPQTLSMYAKLLRMALKASEGERDAVLAAATGVSGIATTLVPPVPAFIQDRLEIEKAKEEFRKSGKRADAEEGLTGSQTELVGGPAYDAASPVFIERASSMPVGAKMFAHDGVYQLRKDGRLHFCAEDTAHAKTVQNTPKLVTS